MEKLVKKICLDTDVAISILRGEEKSENFKEQIEQNQAFISSVTFFELLMPGKDEDKVEYFVNKFEILDFNEHSAREASFIYRELKRKGRLIDFRDIFIAAICISENCELATFNKKHFENIKNLKLLV